ncbi:MAG: amino acid adenylation domain-containing protein [Defluviitaleaceae bacterium]|nr:amino acid adenylation domain-containing protein [Defluviitaleaceae bacterium]
MKRYLMNSIQKRFFTIEQIYDTKLSYNIHFVVKIDGIINSNKFLNTLVKLTERHELLRTSFSLEKKQFVQIIHDHPEIDYTYESVSGEIEEKALYNNFSKRFNLTKAPLLRSKLIQAEKHCYVILEVHHIIADGQSLSILWNEIEAIYFEKSLAPQKIQYKDYGIWQDKKSFTKEEIYWLKEFATNIPTIDLKTDFPRPQKKDFEGINILTDITSEMKEKIVALSHQSEATEFIVMLSIFILFLKGRTNQNELVIGVPVSNRLNTDTHDMLGMFVNTLAIHINLNDEMTFVDLVNSVKEKCYLAYTNREYPFEALVDKLNSRRDASRNPIFDVMFSEEDAYEALTFGDFQINVIPQQLSTSQFDMSVAISKGRNKSSLSLTLSKSLFKEDTASMMTRQYLNLVDRVCMNPMKLIIDCASLDENAMTEESNVLTEKECHQLLQAFNGAFSKYPKEKTIQQLFEERVAKTPDAIALIFGEEKMTYKELNEKANQLARVLHSKDTGSNRLVAMMVERSFEMIVGILAILKSGNAYLPIEPEHPKEWKRFILDDSRTPILLTQSWLNESVEFKGACMNLDDEQLYQGDVNNLKLLENSEDLACVLYTSGSTGKPKGVTLPHKSIVSLLYNMEKYYPLTKGDAYLFKTAYTFDVSVTELFGWFITGEKMVILQPGDEKLPNKIIDAIDKHRITHLNFVPTMLCVFLDELKNRPDGSCQTMKYTFAAGEPLKQDIVSTYYELLKTSKLENIYGSTETSNNTQYTTVANEPNADIPIGKPFSNVFVYILDEHQNMVPIGTPGEICVSGDCLAKGYLNRPDLTAEKFIPNPFAPEMRLYRTGDLARWLPDGKIECLGRIDQQVKIRGFRIELREIESRMRALPHIQESAVIVKERNSIKFIYAYYKSKMTYDPDKLKEFLIKELPEHMIPHCFVKVDEFSYTKSGKLDRKSLLDMKANNMIVLENFKNETERLVSNIFKEVLGVEQAGREAKFLELGGDSLTVIKVNHLIGKTLNHHLEVKDILELNSIRNIASKLEKMEEKVDNNDSTTAAFAI